MLLITRIVDKKVDTQVSHVLWTFPWNCNERSQSGHF
nr:MAG TPA: hypothetical protein [Caudoviricetes sp.]DAR26575.1 MAG TPA: hypothetical protein [Caudoviricetes sp.]